MKFNAALYVLLSCNTRNDNNKQNGLITVRISSKENFDTCRIHAQLPLIKI